MSQDHTRLPPTRGEGQGLTADVRSDPAYHDGFFDAQGGDPLYPDASAEYEAGWRAFWRAREILEGMGFSKTASGPFTKRTVIPARAYSHEG